MTKAFIESKEQERIASFLNVRDDARGLKVLSSNMKLLVFSSRDDECDQSPQNILLVSSQWRKVATVVSFDLDH